MTLVLMAPENIILYEIGIPQMKRKDIAMTYRLVMEAERHGAKVDWLKVNTAIIERWSKSGLQYIKNLAWSDRITGIEPTPGTEGGQR